jgi:hypothetical protein
MSGHGQSGWADATALAPRGGDRCGVLLSRRDRAFLAVWNRLDVVGQSGASAQTAPRRTREDCVA